MSKTPELAECGLQFGDRMENIPHFVHGLPDRLFVPETVELGKYGCGVALLSKDIHGRLDIVTRRYLREGYITENQCHQGLYCDQYESCSVPFVAKNDKGMVVASFRAIYKPGNLPILIEHQRLKRQNISWFSNDWEQRIASTIPWELSQLAKDQDYKDSRPTLGVIRAYIAWAQHLGIDESVAVIDSNVTKLLNGDMKLHLEEIGSPEDYMGSVSTPVQISNRLVVESTHREGDLCLERGNVNEARRFHNLSQFLNTGIAEGFEWYVGS